MWCRWFSLRYLGGLLTLSFLLQSCAHIDHTWMRCGWIQRTTERLCRTNNEIFLFARNRARKCYATIGLLCILRFSQTTLSWVSILAWLLVSCRIRIHLLLRIEQRSQPIFLNVSIVHGIQRYILTVLGQFFWTWMSIFLRHFAHVSIFEQTLNDVLNKTDRFGRIIFRFNLHSKRCLDNIFNHEYPSFLKQ